MFSHVCIGISDFERSLSFYTALMKCLGAELRFCDRTRPWAGWQSQPGPRPLFIIGRPFNQEPQHPGNGTMTAFLAKDRKMVDAAYCIALDLGGVSEGSPGLRPEYHENYYGTYFRDPDGNKLCVVCHSPENA